jgi:hypothetical protein
MSRCQVVDSSGKAIFKEMELTDSEIDYFRSIGRKVKVIQQIRVRKSETGRNW